MSRDGFGLMLRVATILIRKELITFTLKIFHYLCLLGNFVCFLSSADFLKLFLKEKIRSIKNVKQFGFRPGPTF